MSSASCQVFRSLGSVGAIHVDSRRKRTLDCLDLSRLLEALGNEHCSARRSRVCDSIANEPLRRTSASVRLVTDERNASARVRVTNMGALSESRLTELLSSQAFKAAGFSRIVAIRPTGWTFRSDGGLPSGQQTLSARKDALAAVESVGGNVRELKGGKIKIVCLPYSEHSSVAELKEFVHELKPASVIPTVAKSRQHRSELVAALTV
mmetsp:Transcript_18654/g.44550  ORF Transcript_18654/g.44550 Transcript_18654/m.44550 type:complete len:208 (+) Transcript_18654:609-1232(+)